MVASDDGRWLLVANPGSDDLSLFAIESDGLRLEDRVDSGGSKPTSVTVSGEPSTFSTTARRASLASISRMES